MWPTSAHAAYKIGAACPLESTKRSLPGFFGFLGSNFIPPKNSAAIMSAAEQHVLGCPDPAWVVIWTEWMRSRVATSLNAENLSVVVITLCLSVQEATPTQCYEMKSRNASGQVVR